MRNSQRDNGYGRSGVNKKISTNSWKWSEQESLLSVPPSEALGFYGAFCGPPGLRHFYIHLEK